MSGLVQFAKHINAPIAAKCGVLDIKHIFPSSRSLNPSFFRSNDITTIVELSGWEVSIEKRLSSFQVYNSDVEKYFLQGVQHVGQGIR